MLTLIINLGIIVYVVSKPIKNKGFNDYNNIIWLLGQAVKTPPFHGGNRGSIPLGVTIFFGRIAQLGEHLPYKQGVTGSNPVVPTKVHGSVAQLVRVPACHAGCRGFKSLLSRHFFKILLAWLNW